METLLMNDISGCALRLQHCTGDRKENKLWEKLNERNHKVFKSLSGLPLLSLLLVLEICLNEVWIYIDSASYGM